MESVELRREVARLRCQFADRIEATDETASNAASWCEGWRVRDVLAHLVRNAENTNMSLVGDLIRGGMRPDPAVSNAAGRLAHVPVPELADRLRAAAERHLQKQRPQGGMALGDV